MVWLDSGLAPCPVGAAAESTVWLDTGWRGVGVNSGEGAGTGSTRLVCEIGHDTAGVCGGGGVGRSMGRAGRYGCCCSVRAGGGTGSGVVRAVWTGTKTGSGGGSAVILGRSTAGARGGPGAMPRGSGAAGRTVRGTVGCDGTTGPPDGFGSRSTMAPRPAAAGAVGVTFSSSRSQLDGSVSEARRGLGGPEKPGRSRSAVCAWVPIPLGSSARAARARRTTMLSPLSA